METFIAVLISGMAIGSTYALVIIGMTLLLLVRGVVHFGIAFIVVMTAYLGWIVLGLTNNNLFISLPAFVIIGIILTVATEPLFRPMALKRAFIESLTMGLGIAIILTDICSQFINFGQNVAFPSNLTGGGARLNFGMIYLSMAHIYTLVICLLIVTFLFYFLYHHKEGKAIRAMAQDLDVARSLGIPFKRTGIVGFTIAGILVGVAAILIAMTLEQVSATLGDALAIRALILMLFAGMGNLTGGMICAISLGVVESLTLSYLPGRWTNAIIFGIIMLAILWRPNGMFGTRT